MLIKFIGRFFSLKSLLLFISFLTVIFFVNEGKEFFEGTSVLLASALTLFIVGSFHHKG